jgi:hypothetical protein
VTGHGFAVEESAIFGAGEVEDKVGCANCRSIQRSRHGWLWGLNVESNEEVPFLDVLHISSTNHPIAALFPTSKVDWN